MLQMWNSVPQQASCLQNDLFFHTFHSPRRSQVWQCCLLRVIRPRFPSHFRMKHCLSNNFSAIIHMNGPTKDIFSFVYGTLPWRDRVLYESRTVWLSGHRVPYSKLCPLHHPLLTNKSVIDFVLSLPTSKSILTWDNKRW